MCISRVVFVLVTPVLDQGFQETSTLALQYGV